MSGRRKGLEAEREAVAALRAAFEGWRGHAGTDGVRVLHVKRERGAARDVDAVIVIPRRGALAEAVEVQIKREERAPLVAYVRGFVARGRVLVYRRNREPWEVWIAPIAAGDEPKPVPLSTFASLALVGGLV